MRLKTTQKTPVGDFNFMVSMELSEFLQQVLDSPFYLIDIPSPNRMQPVGRQQYYSNMRLGVRNGFYLAGFNNIFLFKLHMIPFYNLEMPSNTYNMMCPTTPLLNLCSQLFPPSYYSPSPMFCLSYLPPLQTFQFGTSSCNLSNSTTLSNFYQEINPLKENKKEFEFLKEGKTKQSNQQPRGTVPKSRTIKKTPNVKYLKKNTESNVSNQVLTFLSDQRKSKDCLVRLCKKQGLDDKEVVTKFYEWMDVIKVSTKKYISKKILLRLSVASSDHLLIKQLSKVNIPLSESELCTFCRLTRILMRLFLTEYSHLTILTSKKIHREGTVEHLTRRRQIKNYLEQKHVNN